MVSFCLRFGQRLKFIARVIFWWSSPERFLIFYQRVGLAACFIQLPKNVKNVAHCVSKVITKKEKISWSYWKFWKLNINNDSSSTNMLRGLQYITFLLTFLVFRKLKCEYIFSNIFYDNWIYLTINFDTWLRIQLLYFSSIVHVLWRHFSYPSFISLMYVNGRLPT